MIMEKNVDILNKDKAYHAMESAVLYHYNNKPIIIKTEEGTETAYIPSFENGEFVIKPIATEYIETNRLEIDATNIKIEPDDGLKSDSGSENVVYYDENFSQEEYPIEYLEEEYLEYRDPSNVNDNCYETYNPEYTTHNTENLTRPFKQDSHCSLTSDILGELNLNHDKTTENQMFPVFDDGYYAQQAALGDTESTTKVPNVTSPCNVLKQQPIINKKPIILGNQKIKPNISIPNAIACRNKLKPNGKYLLDGGLIRMGRKHLVVDTKTMIGPKDFKMQLTNSQDLVQPIELAPCTKKEIDRKLHGLPYFFGHPTTRMHCEPLMQRFQRHCTSRNQENTEVFTDMELLPLGAKQHIDLSKIKRITRRRKYPEAEEYQRQKDAKLKEMQETALVNSQLLNGNGNMEIVINSDEILKFYNPNADALDNDEQQIIVIHDGQESAENNAYTHKNIEVLLAAAAESNSQTSHYQQVFLCDDNIYASSNGKVFINENNQLFLVQDDIGQYFETQSETL